MKLRNFFIKKKKVITETTTKTTFTTDENLCTDKNEQKPFEKVAPEKIGVLDMVIAFDTTGSRRLTSMRCDKKLLN